MTIPLFLATMVSVLLPDGSPAAGVQSVSLTKSRFAHVVGDAFQRPIKEEVILTNESGVLEVTPDTAGRWVLLHSQGWADTVITPETAELHLKPWQNLSGKISAPFEPGAEAFYARTELPQRDRENPGTIYWTSRAPIAADGGFLFTQVPTGHGSVGILREWKIDRRELRWRDYPQAVVVPQENPIALGGGVTVSGRIVAPGTEFPHLITLAPLFPGPAHHGLTDDAGLVSIPGVRPGRYRLTTRPILGWNYKNPVIKNFSVIDHPVELGAISGDFPALELDRRVEVTEDLLPRILTEAQRHSSQPIEKLWIGELIHPGGNFGARVTYQPVIDPKDSTTATRTMLILRIPGETIRKLYPDYDSLGYGFQFSDEPFENIRTFEDPVRVFPLKAQTLYLPLEDGVPYADALALLLAIEKGTIETPETKSKQTGLNTWQGSSSSFGSKISPEELLEIRSIKTGNDGQFKLDTQNRPFGGRSYLFEKTSTGFLQVGGAHWRS